MLFVTVTLIGLAALAFRAGRIVGLAVSILGLLILTVAFALFAVCTAISG
jgi:hypothetical protein